MARVISRDRDLYKVRIDGRKTGILHEAEKENEYAKDGSGYLRAKTKKFKEMSKINKRSRRNKNEY